MLDEGKSEHDEENAGVEKGWGASTRFVEKEQRPSLRDAPQSHTSICPAHMNMSLAPHMSLMRPQMVTQLRSARAMGSASDVHRRIVITHRITHTRAHTHTQYIHSHTGKATHQQHVWVPTAARAHASRPQTHIVQRTRRRATAIITYGHSTLTPPSQRESNARTSRSDT